MKKIFTFFLIAVCSISFASAQSNKSMAYFNHDHGKVMQRDNHSYNDKHKTNKHTSDYNNKWKNDRDRQAAFDRMNRQYDKRIDRYRKDRSLSLYERNRRIREAEQERAQKAKSFGTGMVVGGIAGLIIGVLAGH
jgi:hypothetical protein